MIWSQDPSLRFTRPAASCRKLSPPSPAGNPPANQLAWLDPVAAALEGICAELVLQP
jgi:hypothetical protein